MSNPLDKRRAKRLPIKLDLTISDLFCQDNVKENIDRYLPLNPSIITFHYEICKSDEEVIDYINYIKENNIKPAISIKPATNIDKIKKFLPMLHMVLIMTVEPGKGGQKLIPEALKKAKELKQYLEKNNLDTYIEVDGGVNKDTIDMVKDAGVDIAVAGSSIISADDFKEVISELK